MARPTTSGPTRWLCRSSGASRSPIRSRSHSRPSVRASVKPDQRREHDADAAEQRAERRAEGEPAGGEHQRRGHEQELTERHEPDVDERGHHAEAAHPVAQRLGAELDTELVSHVVPAQEQGDDDDDEDPGGAGGHAAQVSEAERAASRSRPGSAGRGPPAA